MSSDDGIGFLAQVRENISYTTRTIISRLPSLSTQRESLQNQASSLSLGFDVNVEDNAVYDEGDIYSYHNGGDLRVHGSQPIFPFERLIGSIAISFNRFTVQSYEHEPLSLRIFFSSILALMAYRGEPFHVTCAFYLFSYLLPWTILHYQHQQKQRRRKRMRRRRQGEKESTIEDERGTGKGKRGASNSSTEILQKQSKEGDEASVISRGSMALILLVQDELFCFLGILISGLTSFWLCREISRHGIVQSLSLFFTPLPFAEHIAAYLFPIEEMIAAYNLVLSFVDDKDELEYMLHHLLFVTFNIQVGMGYLGIGFLRKEQARRNQLVRMQLVNVDSDSEVAVRRSAGGIDIGKVNGGNDRGAGGVITEEKNGTNGTGAVTHAEGRETGNSTDSCTGTGSDSGEREIATKATSNNGTADGDTAVVQQDDKLNNEEQKKQEEQLKKLRARQWELSRQFRRGAIPFILFTAIPYMIQLIVFGNINMYAFTCFKDEMHRSVRLNSLFQHESHLVAMAEDSATSPGVYATSMDGVVDTVYDLFNRKLFSAPKLVLLPSILAKQPMLLANIFPLILAADKVKAMVVAAFTAELERIHKERNDVKALRTKAESFDFKNADLLRRSSISRGSGDDGHYQHQSLAFTKRRWIELTEKVQTLDIKHALLKRTRGYFQWLQRNFVIMALVDCALATLIAAERIVSADIFVFARAIEDSIDTILMKSRAESELASMMTDIDRLQSLSKIWNTSRLERSLINCRVVEGDTLSIDNLMYSRGTTSVRVDGLQLTPGVYALTGANGSGKSTLFRILTSCTCNIKSIDLHPSIVFQSYHRSTATEDCRLPSSERNLDVDMGETDVDEKHIKDESSSSAPAETAMTNATYSILMPSSDVVEVSQSFYWPLFTKPIDWICQCHISEDFMNEMKRNRIISKVVNELKSLNFYTDSRRSSVQKSQRDDDAIATAATEGSDNEDSRISSEDSMGIQNVTAYNSRQDQQHTQNLRKELLEVKEDWFNELSGGQKGKVELVRKVFLAKSCPKVLLIDETLAPLDPASKTLAMAKIKSFCKNSIVLVVYHNDIQNNQVIEEKQSIVVDVEDHHFEEDVTNQCVPSSNFFDDNIHVENGMLKRRSVCL